MTKIIGTTFEKLREEVNKQTSSAIGVYKGGKGSGNYGHSGRVGMVGGSAPTTLSADQIEEISQTTGLSYDKIILYSDPSLRVGRGPVPETPAYIIDEKGNWYYTTKLGEHRHTQLYAKYVKKNPDLFDKETQEMADEIIETRTEEHASFEDRVMGKANLFSVETGKYGGGDTYFNMKVSTSSPIELLNRSFRLLKRQIVNGNINVSSFRDFYIVRRGFHKIKFNEIETIAGFDSDENIKYKEIRIIKGGKGSGNWGHFGRPGKIGGSQRGGGFKRIGGASLQHASDVGASHVDKLAELYRYDREKAVAIANRVAKDELGYDGKIRFGGAGYDFKVGDDSYSAAGHFNPTTNEVVLFDKAFTRLPRSGGNLYKGLLAHEVQHARFHEFEKKVADEHKDLDAFIANKRKEFTDDNDYYRWFDKEFMRADGSFKQPEHQERWKHLEASEGKLAYGNIATSLMKITGLDDISGFGVSDYSDSYWKVANKSKSTVAIRKAVNETLAEIARRRLEGTWYPANNKWSERNKYWNDIYNGYAA